MTEVHIDQAGMQLVLRGEQGPVAAHVRQVGRRTVRYARTLAGNRTGRLRQSISMERDRSISGEYGVTVGSNVSYALVHHEGARPHVILARRQGRVLRFRPRGGGIVYAKRVKHPGHRGTHYLSRALKMAMTG